MPRPAALDALPSLTAGIAWGAMFPIAHGALEHVDPFHLTAIRYVLASAVFLALLGAVEGRRAFSLAGRGPELLALGTLGFAGFNLLSFVGLEYTRPQNASLIVALQPLFALLAMWLVAGARPVRAQVLAVAVAFVGVALVITRGRPAEALHGGGLGGDGLVVVGCVAWIAYTFGARRFDDFSPLRYTALTATLGTGVILVVTELATLAGLASTPDAGDVRAILGPLAYIVLVAAVLGVVAWNTGVRRIGAPNAALFMNLVPVVAFAIAIGQGYRPGTVEIAGALLALAALVGANLAGRGARAPAPAPRARPRRGGAPARGER
jgi:drug/metabolite transporter (DMT)-like permease